MTSENQFLKMFVLVRSDLESTYRCVQGMHAVAGYYESGNKTDWHNSTMVVLAVKDEGALEWWQWRLEKAKKSFYKYQEPDLNYQMTAIACIDTGEIFKKLQLCR